MGGKLSGLQRSDLLYTTASQEGMIGDSRARRNRKPSAVQEAATAATKEKKEKAKPAKKKPPAKKQKKVAATKTTKKRAAGSNNDKSKSKKAKAAKAPADDPPPTTTTTTMDMYARHRREFERSVIRLEKTDAYHFFQGDVPEELTEGYTKQVETPGTPQENPSSPQTTAEPQLEPNAEAQHNSSSSQSPEMKNGQKSSTKKSKNVDADVNANTIQFPDHPPYNFQILRKRIENGRYELDRLSLEYEERIELIKPYLKSIGKKIPKCNSKKTKAMRLPVLHPIGVDWDLFRKDVIGMCDAAVERNPDPDGSAGTVRHAATKIKEVMEQIYERSGNRHTMEMSSVNDRHRFSLAMDSFNNVEAAMQGKWRREGKTNVCEMYLPRPHNSLHVSQFTFRLLP